MTKTIGTTDKLLGKVVGFTNEEGRREKPIWEMTKEIKVKILDWKPIIEKIKASSPKLSNLNLQIRSGKGIIFVGKDKTPVLIDSECCGVDAEDKNVMINGELLCGMFVEGIGIFKKEEGFVAMMPMFYVDFDYDDVEKCFTGEEKELWEFMGERYEYNPRIHSNLREIVKLFKGEESK